MKAKEFYEILKGIGTDESFTELTNTGIRPNYEAIFKFAEAYHTVEPIASECEIGTKPALDLLRVSVSNCPVCSNKPTRLDFTTKMAYCGCGNCYFY